MDSLPVLVADTEGVTRFLFQSNQFTASSGRVRPPAMMPYENKQKQRWETSAIRTDHLQTGEIWALGYLHAENVLAGRRIRARGIGEVAAITALALQLDVNGDPYPRHVDIVGWPNSNDKAARMMVATEIANEMSLEIDPRP